MAMKRLRGYDGGAHLVPRALEVANFESQSAVPGSATQGDVYYDDGTNTGSGQPSLRAYNGTEWLDVANTKYGEIAAANIELTDGSNNVVKNGSSNCRWQRTGRLVTFSLNFRWTGTGSTSGTMYLTGALPYDADGASGLRDNALCVQYSWGLNITATLDLSPTIVKSLPSQIRLYLMDQYGGGGAPAQLQASMLSTAGALTITGSYFTDDAF